MARVHNFSAGPAALPQSVLEEVASELVEYGDAGMSVLEMSHRSANYQAIYDHAEASLRNLLDIPDTYRVMFLQGGATLEFAAIPLNLMRTGHADYLVTGSFAKKAWQEGTKYGEARAAASSEDTGFDRICDPSTYEVDKSADYLHICENNTIYGTMYHELPNTGDVPLVSDMSSCFLARPADVTRYGVIYAGAQKNAGPAGVTIVIAREDLIGEAPALDICPTYLNWATQAKAGSMYNTPNTFGIYLCGKVFDWVKAQGGVAAMEERNRAKSDMLYDIIDASDLYQGVAQPGSRSICNVTFRCPSPEMDAQFVAGATERGLIGVKGHRAAGGIRASLYNAVEPASAKALADYMKDFESQVRGSSRSL